MIELNPEQVRAMEPGRPMRIIDSETHDAYVLVRAEDYERLAGASARARVQVGSEIPPMVFRSQQAYWRDLPGLLKDERNRGNWLAYHGDERVAFCRSDLDAFQECFRRGLKPEEIYVGKVEADPDGAPPWGTPKTDWSLFEAVEGTLPEPA